MANQSTLRGRFFAPVDVASLVYFRIAFGAIMLWEVWRYFAYGWIKRVWIDPAFHFTYYGFEWVRPWPGDGMSLHFLALGGLAILIMLGLWYRVSTLLFFLGFTYVFLLEQAQYLNHFYLICLISLLMIFTPAHRAFSVDACRRPGIRSDAVDAWTLWLLRTQIAIAYIYGGLAKLNSDWLHGEPMRMSLAKRSDYPLLGPFFEEEWMVYLFSYSGLLIDLLVVPFLLWRKTRPFAFVLGVLFHLTNAWLFRIGIFPWFMIAATALFFAPDWPRRMLGLSQGPLERLKTKSTHGEGAYSASLHRRQYATMGLLGIYLAVQLLVPLRHYLYPGNVSWTEEGHRFAWHMKLRHKTVRALFLVTDPVGNMKWVVEPGEYLTPWQERKMSVRPDLILQFSHHIANEMRKQGYEHVEVRAKVWVSLNGRKPQLLIDPRVDLAAQPRTLMPAPWITRLEDPLPTD